MHRASYPPIITERFWAKVHKTDGCWLWTASTTRGGYGQFKPGKGCNPVGAHKFSYELVHGLVPPGFQVDHMCREPVCVNPAHLEAVTYSDNQRRGAGSKLTWDQVCAIRASSETDRVLALRYGVDPKTIWNIRRNLKWATAPLAPSGSRIAAQGRLL